VNHLGPLPAPTALPSPRVTALILFHDEVEFVAEAVCSVLTQDFTDFEAILIDDSAEPRCASFARDLCEGSSGRLRHLRTPGDRPVGPKAARLFAMEQARGEFIATLDADDVWEQGKLREQVALLDAHPEAAVVYGRTLMWQSWAPEGVLADEYLDLGLPFGQLVPGLAALAVLLANRSQAPTTCNVIMRSAMALPLLRGDYSFGWFYEDQEDFVRIFARHPIVVSDRTWARYRQRPRSICHSMPPLREALLRRQFLSWSAAHLRSLGIVDPRVRAILRAERWANRDRILRLSIKRLLGM
jgi:glycosyltransferase involved in cell wall biosynthesis